MSKIVRNLQFVNPSLTVDAAFKSFREEFRGRRSTEESPAVWQVCLRQTGFDLGSFSSQFRGFPGVLFQKVSVHHQYYWFSSHPVRDPSTELNWSAERDAIVECRSMISQVAEVIYLENDHVRLLRKLLCIIGHLCNRLEGAWKSN